MEEVLEVLQEFCPMSFEEITVGLSAQKKYHVCCKDGKEYFVKLQRTSDFINQEIENDIKQIEFLIKNGITTPRIIKAGFTTNGTAYWVFDWVQGETLMLKLSTMPKEEQYNVGYRAGGLLRYIHDLQLETLTPGETVDCIRNEVQNCLRRYEQYKLTGAECYKGDVFEKFLIEYDKTSQFEIPCTLLHGDFHAGNLLIDDGGCLHVLDWVYGKRGLAINDFVRVIVSATWSQEFAIGQINGYFSERIPLHFWENLKLYVAMHELEILSLNFPNMPDGTSFVSVQHNIAMKEYDGMKLLVPLFYER